MDFREREIDFQEADRRYAELKRHYDAGTISTEEFDEQRRQLAVRDDEGRWWAKSRSTGEWHYYNGSAWVRATPPGYRPPQAPPAQSVPDRQPQPEQDERSSPTQTTPPGGAPVQGQDGEKRRRGVLGWAIVPAALLLAVVVVVWVFAPGSPEEGGSPPDVKASEEVESGYSLFEHPSGALSVQVPVGWDERIVIDEAGEKGRASWTLFLGDDESAGPSMTAVNDFESWSTGTWGHRGVYMVGSNKLAQQYSDDELVAVGPNDYSSSCEQGTIQDFDRPPYSGKMLEWTNCGGDSDHTALTLAAAPEGRECVVVAQIGGYFWGQTGEESIQRILDTFEADCSKIA